MDLKKEILVGLLKNTLNIQIRGGIPASVSARNIEKVSGKNIVITSGAMLARIFEASQRIQKNISGKNLGSLFDKSYEELLNNMRNPYNSAGRIPVSFARVFGQFMTKKNPVGIV